MKSYSQDKNQITLRDCEESDLIKLEWGGMFTDQRDLIQKAFARKEIGEIDMIIADLNGYPVGQIWIDFSKKASENIAILWALRVVPTHQRKGIGTKLANFALDRVKKRNFNIAEIGVEKDNPEAQKLYEKLGFEIIGDNIEKWEYTTPAGEKVQDNAIEWIMQKRV